MKSHQPNSSNNNFDISIIIPAFNEAGRIGRSLEKLTLYLKKRIEKIEVIVVDDASTDKTSQEAKSFKSKIKHLKVIRLEESPFDGKGLAVNTGILAARGKITLFTDADFSTPIEEMGKLLQKVNTGYDIAIGSRALDRSLVKKHQNFLREFMGRTFNVLVRLLTVKGIVDTQCGFKAFKMPEARALFENQKIFDFGFDVEILYLAQKKGMRIAEVPTIWYNDPRSSVHPIKDSYKMFIDLIKIRMYHGSKEGSLSDKIFYLLYHYRTFWRFSIVGASNTTVDLGFFYLLTRQAGLNALAANPISVEIAIIWSFIWNNIWTFSERDVSKPLPLRFLTFQFVSLGALAVGQTALLILIEIFDVFDLLAKVIIIPLTLIVNYTLNSRWTFREVSAGKGAWYAYIGFIIFIFTVYFTLIWYITGDFGFFVKR